MVATMMANLQIGLKVTMEQHRIAIGAFEPEIVRNIALGYEGPDLGADEIR